MEETSLRQQRTALKHILLGERQKLYGKRFLAECAYCGQGIETAPDMHEVLFTKGDIQGADHLTTWLDRRANCVLVHPGGTGSKCHAGIQTKEGQLRAIRHLIYWEGIDSLHAYVDFMAEYMKGSQCAHAHNLIDLGGSYEVQSLPSPD